MRSRTFVALLSLLSLNVSAQAPAGASRANIRPYPVEIVERRCPTVLVYQRGNADNFAAPTDPTYPSLALDAFLQTGAVSTYDDTNGCDHWFGDSFKVDACALCCGLCSATLEITMRSCGSFLDCNDSITVGHAPFNGGPGGYVIFSGYVNSVGCNDVGTGTPNPLPDDIRAEDRTRPSQRLRPGPSVQTIVKTIELDPRKVAELVCEKKISTLDVFIQDDQIIDSMRLIITKP